MINVIFVTSVCEIVLKARRQQCRKQSLNLQLCLKSIDEVIEFVVKKSLRLCSRDRLVEVFMSNKRSSRIIVYFLLCRSSFSCVFQIFFDVNPTEKCYGSAIVPYNKSRGLRSCSRGH